MSEASPILSNQLLSALPDSVCQRLTPYLEEVSLTQGQFLHKSGEPITEIYFPHQAAISLVLMFSDRSTTEIGIVGNEGMVGLPAILGSNSSTSSSIVQIGGIATKIASQILLEEFNRGEELQRLLLLYAQVRFSQIAQIAACQSHHGIEKRLARWLLLARNATNSDVLPVTQKVISMMLGVRRASVTEAAISLQKADIINYSRGQIMIVNPQKLQSIACECYGKIQEEYMRLLK